MLFHVFSIVPAFSIAPAFMPELKIYCSSFVLGFSPLSSIRG